jgi:hypothetical protein
VPIDAQPAYTRTQYGLDLRSFGPPERALRYASGGGNVVIAMTVAVRMPASTVAWSMRRDFFDQVSR